MITKEDLKNLENKIKEEKRPMFFETPYGKFAFVLSDEAKEFVINKGFIPIKIEDLKNLILNCNSYQEQKEKVEKFQKELSSFFTQVFKVKELFEGKVETFKTSKKER